MMRLIRRFTWGVAAGGVGRSCEMRGEAQPAKRMTTVVRLRPYSALLDQAVQPHIVREAGGCFSLQGDLAEWSSYCVGLRKVAPARACLLIVKQYPREVLIVSIVVLFVLSPVLFNTRTPCKTSNNSLQSTWHSVRWSERDGPVTQVGSYYG
ncbi:hypothetical protein L209DRAFT_204948 [Thermothelomyces heterothallicus CBS 203.75]